MNNLVVWLVCEDAVLQDAVHTSKQASTQAKVHKNASKKAPRC